MASGHVDSTRSGVFDDPVPFGKTLNATILVPFPMEACLSGAFQWPLYSQFMYYRTLFDAPSGAMAEGFNVLLHFGAVDWNTTVYLNGVQLSVPHLGGYDGFSYQLPLLKTLSNELILAVFDPSDLGYQPNGKQRFSAITKPEGDQYTPSSGIWQTVWMEVVPMLHVSRLRLRADRSNLIITVVSSQSFVPSEVSANISLNGTHITSFSGPADVELTIPLPKPVSMWHPDHPFLYDLSIQLSSLSNEGTSAPVDTISSYFGAREVGLANFTVAPQPSTGPKPGYDCGKCL